MKFLKEAAARFGDSGKSRLGAGFNNLMYGLVFCTADSRSGVGILTGGDTYHSVPAYS